MENVAFFTWDDDMSVGVAEIDEQHKTLVAIINTLFAAAVQRENGEITSEILDTLVKHTKTHFGLEEKMMQDAGCEPADFAVHQHEHHAFIEKIRNIASTHLEEGKPVSFEAINFLKHFLQDHILYADKKHATVLQDSGCSTQACFNSPSNTMTGGRVEMAKRKTWQEIFQAQQNVKSEKP